MAQNTMVWSSIKATGVRIRQCSTSVVVCFLDLRFSRFYSMRIDPFCLGAGVRGLPDDAIRWDVQGSGVRSDERFMTLGN